jgi:glycosyltransferase involved in cell wall biosynthesis
LKSIENKIHGKVVYCTNLPWKDAMMRLKESSVLVVPSRMESQPQVIKEAFYLKTTVVATSVGDIPNLVQNDVTGILVEPNNPEQILKSINYILANKEKSERYCQVAYDFVMKNFTWDVLLQKYVDFYENLVKWN